MFIDVNVEYSGRTVMFGNARGAPWLLVVDASGAVISSQTFPGEKIREGIETDFYFERSPWGAPATRFFEKASKMP